MGKFIDLTNQTFNRWKVIKKVGKNKHKEILWLCECTCGNLGYVTSGQLKRNISKSCGCLKHDVLIQRNTCMKTHGLSKTRLYGIWEKMKIRCYSINCKDYKDYGARGIRVCSEWYNDFLTFKSWAESNNYKENLTIDRINVNGNYEPFNCRWATSKVQANNKRNNTHVTLNGITKTLSEWSSILGICRKTLQYRLNHGWAYDEFQLPAYAKMRK